MSEIRANTVSDAAGTGPVTLTGQYAAKAWVNFNGTGTVAIRESGNVSSITDNGTGDYTTTMASALDDANFVIAGTGTDDSASTKVIYESGTYGLYRTATQFRVRMIDVSSNAQDGQGVYLQALR